LGHLLWSLRQIRMRLFESILIIVAIGLGVGALCSVAALLIEYRSVTERQLREVGIIYIREAQRDRIGLVSLGSDSSPVKLIGRVDDKPVTLTVDDIIALETEVPAVKYAFATRYYSFTIAGADPQPSVDFRTQEGQQRLREWQRANSVAVHLTFPSAFAAHGMELHSGSLFMKSDIEEGRLVGVIGWNLARRHFGDSDPIGRSFDLQLGNSPVSITVIGVLKEIKTDATSALGGYSLAFTATQSSLNDSLFMPYTALETVYRSLPRAAYSAAAIASINQIYVIPSDDVDLGTALARIRSYVSSKYGLGLSVYSPLETLQASSEMIRRVAIVIAAFGSVALVIAAVNTLNLMIARVLRRTKSFGISAALGLSRRGRFAQFMTECFAVSLFGAAIGMGLTVAFTKVLSAFVARGAFAVSVPLEVWLIGVAVAVVATLVFGLYPALQASRIDVVDALRIE
jgi:putative ABC transport system permease protein